MTRMKRCNHTPEFKAQVAIPADTRQAVTDVGTVYTRMRSYAEIQT